MIQRLSIERIIPNALYEQHIRERMLQDLYTEVGKGLEIGTRYSVLITMEDTNKDNSIVAKYVAEIDKV